MKMLWLQAAGMGAHALAGWFAAQLALIYLNQGRPEPAQAAADVAGRLLEAGCGSRGAGLGDLLARAACLTASAKLAWQAGGTPDCGGDAGLQLCQEALAACQQAARLAGARGQPLAEAAAEAAACAAAAHLAAAEQLAAVQGGVAVALGHARQALAGLEACGTSCSTSTARCCRIAALLFLGLHGTAPLPQAQPGLLVWGLGTQAAAGSAAAAASPAAKGGRRAPAKGRAPRGKAAAAAAAEEAATAEPATGGPAFNEEAALWQVFAQSGELPGPCRAASAELARACGQRGQLHLAAVLLQASLGATMRLQYRLVAHSKAQQAQRGAQGGRPPPEAAHLDLLTSGLDWGLVEELGVGGAAAEDGGPSAPARGRGGQRAQQAAAPASAAGRRQACLAALEAQAAAALQRWLAVLPDGTTVCSVSPRLSRRAGGPPAALLVCRLAPGGTVPPLVVELSVPSMEASLSQHPIRALCMDVELADASGSGRQCG